MRLPRIGVLVGTMTALLSPRAHTTGVALSDCRPPLELERKAATEFARDFGRALQRNDLRVLRVMLSDPVLVRLDGKKQAIHWEVVKDRFSEVFGPRVRDAASTGRLKRTGGHWMLGDSVIFLGLAQHGAACGLEIERIFEQPSPTR